MRAALLVLVGAAGSGKSTWAREHFDGRHIVSLDGFRRIVSGDESDQDATGDAVELLHLAVRARLSRRLTTVVDATSTTLPARRALVTLSAEVGMPAIAVVFCTPLAVCLERQERRPATPTPGCRWACRVPAETVRTQHEQAMTARPGLRAEGFAQVQMIRWEPQR